MLKNLQALRAIAALLVVFDHLNGELAHSDPGATTLFSGFRYIGNIGVDLFFVISGFIMVATTWDVFEKGGASETFLLRRLARIYPPYWLVLLPIAIAYFAAAHTLMHAHEGRADVLASFLLLPQEHDPLLIVSWTLTFEMFFYAVFALLLKAPRAWLPWMLASWFACEVIASATLRGAHNPYLGFLSTPLPIEFILGAYVGFAYRSSAMRGARLAASVGVAAVVVIWIASGVPGLTADLTRNDLWRVAQFGLPAALIVYGAVGLEKTAASLAPTWLVGLGDASYATYLWHVPVTIVLGALATRLRVHGPIGDTLALVGSLAFVLVLSIVAYRYFERPVTRWLNKAIASRSRLPGDPVILSSSSGRL